ncbi:MAG: V-type ATP synthase subunit F [Promethearchaeota archaeon]|jgi:vacuolar-type H+-ATPase subunit F/Vma7
MLNQGIFVIGNEEFVLMMGLLGIEGKIIENEKDFKKEFDNLIKDKSIGMIIIAINLSESEIEYLFEYKLNNRKPFIFYLPDAFKTDIEEQNIFISKAFKFISKIIS